MTFAIRFSLIYNANTIYTKNRIRIYHGDADGTVPVRSSRNAYRKLKSLGAKVEYKEFISCGHNSWTAAFSEPDFMSWLFKQHR